VTSLTAEGRVVVARDNTKATAGLARLDARQGLLVLEKSPVLVQESNRLEGERISIHIASGKIEVIGAKGSFDLKLEGR
jgi:lipopolysaccharide export system protein LptA